MNYRDWHVGMKVVCLKSVNPAIRGSISARGSRVGTALGANYPEKGRIYTLRHINAVGDEILVLLEECRNGHLVEFIRGGLEPGFSARHFRPVQPRKTDISIFQAMLTDARRKVDA